MTPHHVSMARSSLYSLLAEVRREAIPLVDAFDVPDEILNSALGRYDGDVYTDLYQWAQRAPRNKKKVWSLTVYFIHLSTYRSLSLLYLSISLSLSLSVLLRFMMCTTSTSRNCSNLNCDHCSSPPDKHCVNVQSSC